MKTPKKSISGYIRFLRIYKILLISWVYIRGYKPMNLCNSNKIQYFHAQKWSFWMVSVEFDHRLPAELPLTAENHWFPSQIQPQPGPGPPWGNQWIWDRKIMFFTGRSALNVFRTLLRPGNHPHGTRKVSETIWYHGIGWDPHNPEISNLVFWCHQKTGFVHTFNAIFEKKNKISEKIFSHKKVVGK